MLPLAKPLLRDLNHSVRHLFASQLGFVAHWLAKATESEDFTGCRVSASAVQPPDESGSVAALPLDFFPVWPLPECEAMGVPQLLLAATHQLLLPWLRLLLSDPQPPVRAAACSSLVVLLRHPLARHGPSQRLVLDDALALLSGPSADEYQRESAVSLLRACCGLLPVESLISTHLPRLADGFACDRHGIVREAAVPALGAVASLLRADQHRAAIASLLACFLTLTADPLWKVRKECVVVIPALAPLLDEEVLHGAFTERTVALLQDDSRWVRFCFAEDLGRIIVCYSRFSRGPPSQLVDFFVGMASKAALTLGIGDQDGAILAAYSFPAVLSTMGAGAWEPQLKAVYLGLSRDFQHRVRKTLAHSLHEVARALGEQATEADLLPVFDRYLSDSPEVMQGVVQNIGQLLQFMSPKQRKKYLPLLKDLYADKDDWRSRLSIVQQLGALAPIVSPEFVVEVLLGSCRDRVAEIRSAASSQIGPSYATLASSNPLKAAELLAGLLPMAADKIQLRQTFARAAFSMLLNMPAALYAEQILPGLLRLAQDPVANIRLACASVVSHPLLKTSDFAPLASQIAHLIAQLKEDNDLEIRQIMNQTY